jgi:plastocyanin
VLLSCGGGNPPAKPVEKAAPVEYFHVDPATAGSVAGKVTFSGTKPAVKMISMEADAGCQAANAGHSVPDPSVLVSKSGALANVFVYIQSGLEGRKFQPPADPVVLDQHGCMFTPRVLGLQAGQPLVLKNGDAVSHNIHPLPKNNREWNQEQAPNAAEVQHKFAREEVMVPVKCNIHNWMHAYIGVLEHPYFAVTGADGSFEIRNLPPGDYTLTAWQEKLGEQKQQIHIAPSAAAAVNFMYQ